MKRTFTRTTFIEDLTEAVFTLYLTEKTKYETADLTNEAKKVEYSGVTAFEIIEGGAEAEEIESETDEDGMDEYHEYYRLVFEDGTTSTFRNSHVVSFIR